jgi:hypothetical protein
VWGEFAREPTWKIITCSGSVRTCVLFTFSLFGRSSLVSCVCAFTLDYSSVIGFPTVSSSSGQIMYPYMYSHEHRHRHQHLSKCGRVREC